jgi:FKBP-type peptidyl-prolyl cis-trans isomerase
MTSDCSSKIKIAGFFAFSGGFCEKTKKMLSSWRRQDSYPLSELHNTTPIVNYLSSCGFRGYDACMFPFGKKIDRSKIPPKPAWLKWGLLAFAGYAMVMVSMPGNKAHQSLQQTQAKLGKNEILNIGEYKNKIFPEHAAGLRINDVEKGVGDYAVCGQRVSIAYESFLAQGNKLPDAASKEKPLTFIIGDHHVMPVFDSGVIGMQVGGKRSIIAPPLMSYGLEDYRRDDVPKGAAVRFEMELLSAEPKIPEVAEMPYRIAEVGGGNGAVLVCGEQAHLRIKLWDLSGKLLYSNVKDKESLAITTGKSEVMLGLEQGVLGMREGGTRLLIIPPAFQKTMSGAASKFALPLPKDQTVMVEVEALVVSP